jgi:hypothetical protein
MVFVPLRKHSYGPPRPVTGIAYFLFVDDVRTSQETPLWASTACYGDSFTFLYVAGVRILQETHIWASAACYGDWLYFLLLVFYVVSDLPYICNIPLPIGQTLIWSL